MAQRNVVWTKTADIQFVSVLEYWAKRNKSNFYSKKLIKVVSKCTEQLANNPFLGKASDFKNTRAFTLRNFSIFYQVTNTQLIITAFWDNRQNPQKLLEILQEKTNK